MEKAAVHTELLTVTLVLHVQNGGQESLQGGVLLIVFRVIGGILAVKMRKAEASIIQELINKRRYLVRCIDKKMENIIFFGAN